MANIYDQTYNNAVTYIPQRCDGMILNNGGFLLALVMLELV